VILRRVLIANRGEIAVRVIRTCERLGIETVLAASAADMDSVAARRATQVICLGPAPANRSYLCVDAVMAAAIASRADAIHPGYGFLSENAGLAEACEAAGKTFIGPTPAQLRAVGDKLKARSHALAAGLPVVPGGEAANLAQAGELAARIGYPVLIKSVGGGGGRGMQLVRSAETLAAALDLAIAEASAAFGDPRVYVERFVAAGRHIEVQVLGDGRGVVHLGTRDCSIQRRYQKLIEEAPAPRLRAELREQMQNAALAFARHLEYRGLGTVELLMDCERDSFHFLEMNARIQVEHPVTEAITGLDLVEEQIAVAEGRALRFGQAEIRFDGHAIECRINAEAWRDDFRPCPGRIDHARFAAGEGIRVDTHIEAGVEIPPYYDSLMAKLIAFGRDRPQALERLVAALRDCDIRGVESTLPMHLELLQTPEFEVGAVTTAYFPQFLASHAAVSGAL
jgi:acetyl-CoA carboxylase biotin carboxylase subunit